MSEDAATSTRGNATADRDPRCWRCHKKLAELLSRPWVITCVRCKARNQSAAVH